MVYPLLHGKQWRFIRVAEYSDNYPLKQPTTALNDVEVPQGDRVKATRINGNHEEGLESVIVEIIKYIALNVLGSMDTEVKLTSMSSKNEIFTIGHSNLSVEAFISLLQQHGITAVVDVRSHPYSRYLPHFNKSQLEAALRKAGIEYRFLGRELGARSDDRGCYVDGKASYEKIAATQLFDQGIKRLLKGVANHKIALMCAERDPITCHRSILVCQHLRSFDLNINHILADANLEPHEALEERLLELYGLNRSESQPKQLSLFEPQLQGSLENQKPREECLKEAYKRQGDKIAYKLEQESNNYEEID